jgi:parvulin-like peptidyl-prolyl isomerase
VSSSAPLGARFMQRLRLTSLVLLALLALVVAAGCGGDDDESVPADAVAVVGDVEVQKSEFNALLGQAKRSYEAQKREFPKAGTPEYATLKNQAVAFLVQRAQFEQQAEELDVEISDKQVDARLEQTKKQYFGGDEKRYQAQLKEQGLTEAQVRRDLRAQLLQEELFKKVTSGVKVSDADVKSYYEKNKDQYGQPESRDIRHILVPTKRQAQQLYDQLKAGGNFAQLAKRHSKDPGSKDQGGKLTVAKGQTVPPFDQTAFLLPKGSLSRPVKTQYGWHLIEPLSAVKPAKTTPLQEVRESIRQQLLQTKKNERMTKWVEDTKKDFADRTHYQTGYAPPETTTTGRVTTNAE